MSKPNELFKYRDFGKYTILSLLTKGIWIPKPSQLNDPFDAQLKLSISDISFEQFKSTYFSVRNTYSKKEVRAISAILLESLFENDKPNKDLRREMALFSKWWDSKTEKIGILSLSEDPKSITMWSHYADNHTGICIGYSRQKLISQLGCQPPLRQVDYLKEQDIIRNAYLLYARSGVETGIGTPLPADYQLNHFLKTVSTKSIDWAYEKEWRILLPDSGGNSHNLTADAISSITFGLRTSAETKQAISHLFDETPIRWFQTM